MTAARGDRPAQDRRATRALRPGHELQLLRGGSALFAALVEAIDAARDEVLLETYIFDFQGATLAVAESLERAAARGVCVRIVVDGVGTGEIPTAWAERWTAANVHWRVFNPARGWRLLLLPTGWRRLHRKLCVVDAPDRLLRRHQPPRRLRRPELRRAREAALRFRGPGHRPAGGRRARDDDPPLAAHAGGATRQDAQGTVRSVREAAGAGTDMGDSALTAGDPRSGEDIGRPGDDEGAGALAGLVLRDNLRFRRRIEHFYRYAIREARSEIIIANAYFIPGIHLQRALIDAARRGVRVTVLVQGRYEYFMQHHTSRALYRLLLDAGIEIIEYEPSFLHAKVAVFDGVQGAIATVGSSNLDPLSLLLAREANVFVRDEAFAAGLRGHLVEAIRSDGARVESSQHLRRPFAKRVLAWIAYTAMRFALFATRHRY